MVCVSIADENGARIFVFITLGGGDAWGGDGIISADVGMPVSYLLGFGGWRRRASIRLYEGEWERGE
jgi:hypothetical protein